MMPKQHRRLAIQMASRILLVASFLTIAALEADAQGFLTLPFNDPQVRIIQGWIYNFVPSKPWHCDPPEDDHCHRGIDYIKGNGSGTSFKVFAAADGKAVVSRSVSYGTFVYIAHEKVSNKGRYFTIYAHLKTAAKNIKPRTTAQLIADIAADNFSQWTEVGRGFPLGESGDSGAANGVIHLHFEVQIAGYGRNKTDPYYIYGTRDSYPEPCAPSPTIGWSAEQIATFAGVLWQQCPPDIVPTAGFTMTVAALPPKTNGQTLTVSVPIGGTALIDVSSIDCSPGPATGCSYDPDGRIFSRAWTLDGTPITLLPTDAVPLELTPGTHTVTLAVTDDRGAQSAPVSGTIVVAASNTNQPPTAGFAMTSSAQSAIEGQTLIVTVPPGTSANTSFDGSRSHDATGGAVSAFAWNIDGQLVSTASMFSQPVAGGMHTISLVVKDRADAPSLAAQGTIAVQDFSASIAQLAGGIPVGVSRDGSIVVSNIGGLFSAPSDGSAAPTLITPPGFAVVSFYPPHFSGTKVVFVAQQGPFYGCSNLRCEGEVYVVNPDGTGLNQLTTGGAGFDGLFGGITPVQISANGQVVVFVRDRISYVIDSDGSNRHSLFLPAAPSGTFPGALTSDGSRVLYACIAPESTRFDSLCVIGTDGTNFHQIVIGTGLREGTLSGDGTTIAYSADGGERTITDGTFRVVRGGGGLSLTHDGSVLCYWASSSFFTVDIFCVNTDGTNLRNLTTNPSPGESYFPSISENGAVVTFFTAVGPATGTFAAMLKPSLAIDLGPTSTRSQGDTFSFNGFGFTKDRPVTRRMRQLKSGTEVTLTPSMSADGTGHLPPWAFQSTCETPPGDYLIWVIDDATGRISNTVTETVTRNPACP